MVNAFAGMEARGDGVGVFVEAAEERLGVEDVSLYRTLLAPFFVR